MEIHFTNDLRPYPGAVRTLLRKVGWDEPYIAASEANAVAFSAGPPLFARFAVAEGALLGFVFVQFHQWNRLAQIQGLAVDPERRRHGVALQLVEAGEAFARTQGARGIFLDTPVPNEGGRRFYEAVGYRQAYRMPRYYEDSLDGVTYQKFFEKP